uniref:Uncharacterized protein n=1 Tax=Psilocybe cubensis TaxID=181762 RepID=A0A8H8CFL6_PSICU
MSQLSNIWKRHVNLVFRRGAASAHKDNFEDRKAFEAMDGLLESKKEVFRLYSSSTLQALMKPTKGAEFGGHNIHKDSLEIQKVVEAMDELS